jgi:transposase
MIKGEKIMDIRSLAKQGYFQRHIARLTGLSRKTVKKYLEETRLPVYKAVTRESMLGSYRGLIEGWLSQQDYQATRIYELLQGEGFTGPTMWFNVMSKALKSKEIVWPTCVLRPYPGIRLRWTSAIFKSSARMAQASRSIVLSWCLDTHGTCTLSSLTNAS